MEMTAHLYRKGAALALVVGGLLLASGCGRAHTVEDQEEEPMVAMAGVQDADVQNMSERDLQRYHDTRRKQFTAGSKEEYVNGTVSFKEVIEHKIHEDLRIYRGGVHIRFKGAKFRSTFIDFDDADLTCDLARVRFRKTAQGWLIDEVAARGGAVFSSDRGYLISRNKVEIDFENTGFHSGGVVFVPFKEDPDRKRIREEAEVENAAAEGRERTVTFDKGNL